MVKYIRFLVKSILGENFYICLRKSKRMLLYLISFFSKYHKKLVLISDKMKVADILQEKDKNIFFGYYDLQQFNYCQGKLLLHMVGNKANPAITPVDICVYDMKSSKYDRIASSSAWSWQQGARLRWSSTCNNHILFNNCVGNKYVCEVWDVDNHKHIDTFPIALYDIDAKQEFGLSVNFSRLQRLRPGYGYSTIPDDTINEAIPENDGIFKCDLITKEVKLIISYIDLCKDLMNAEQSQHYINHISIAPDGEHFMFFHVWTSGDKDKWNVRLYVATSDGSELKMLEEDDIISHYTWKDNRTILTTKINREGKGSCYAEYDIIAGDKSIVGGAELALDGHPTFFDDHITFITDTYPQKHNIQELYKYDIVEKKKEVILQVFHDPRLFGEHRCDLHPRLTPDNQYVTFDTVCSGKRQVVVLKMNV